MVAEIGVKHVIQVITNNHTSYVRRCKTNGYKAHCIDLMLEDIGKMRIHTETFETTKGIV